MTGERMLYFTAFVSRKPFPDLAKWALVVLKRIYKYRRVVAFFATWATSVTTSL